MGRFHSLQFIGSMVQRPIPCELCLTLIVCSGERLNHAYRKRTKARFSGRDWKVGAFGLIVSGEVGSMKSLTISLNAFRWEVGQGTMIPVPLISVPNTAEIAADDECDTCYRSDLVTKKCIRCHVAKYCTLECQKLAWKRYLKQECMT